MTTQGPEAVVPVALLVHALDIIEQYRDYAETMREHGRGFYPDSFGCKADSVADGISYRLWLKKQPRELRDGRWHVLPDADREARIKRLLGIPSSHVESRKTPALKDYVAVAEAAREFVAADHRAYRYGEMEQSFAPWKRLVDALRTIYAEETP